MRNQFSELLAAKGEIEGGEISLEEVNAETGIPLEQLAWWLNDEIEYLHWNTLEALFEYFGCEAGKLLVMEKKGC